MVGKIVVDATNPLQSDWSGKLLLSSKGVKGVKAFNMIFAVKFGKY